MPFIPNTFGDVSSSGLGALGVNGGDFLIQLISFIIVFLVLKKFAFKPIIKIMSDRRKLIESGVQLGDEMKKKSAELEEEISKKLHDARVEADKMISSAQQDARELVAAAEESAKEKVAQISAEAQERIKRDTATARKQLEGELIGLISEATEAIINEKVDPKKDAELIEKAFEAKEDGMKQPRHIISNYVASDSLKNGVSKKLGKEIAAYLLSENRTADLDSILRDVQQDWADAGIVEVIAVSAFDISSKVKSDIEAEIKKLYPHAKKIIVTEQYDEAVIAGVRLELANEQLDLTVLNKLNKFKQLSVSERNN